MLHAHCKHIPPPPCNHCVCRLLLSGSLPFPPGRARCGHHASTWRGTCPRGGGGLLPFCPLLGRPTCRGSSRARPVGGGGWPLGSSRCFSRPVPLLRLQARCTHIARTITSSLVVRIVLLPRGGSRLVSLTLLVSRAYSLLCLTYWRRYIPGWRRLMMKCGQRGGLTVCLEGLLCHPPPLSRGGPLSRHHTARGGLTTHPFPGACVPTSTHPGTAALVSVCGK